MKKIKENIYVSNLIFSDTLNSNGRIYSSETVLNMKKQFEEKLLKNPVFGELGYPASFETSVKNISHKINRVYFENKKYPRKIKKKLKRLGLFDSKKILKGEIQLLDTPNGRLAKVIFDELVARPRSTGTVDRNGNVTIQEVLTFDLINKKDDAFKEK